MKVKVPLYKTSCLVSLIQVIGIVAIIISLSGCTATVENKYPDGSTSMAKVPFGYRYDETNKILESDPRIIEASSKALIEIGKQSPEIIDKISKNAMEYQKQQTNN